MLKVYKYPVPVYDEFDLSLPKGAMLLSFQTQGMTPCVWALVDPDALNEVRRFRLAGTGHPIQPELYPKGIRHVGTTQMLDGSLIWHLFEIL